MSNRHFSRFTSFFSVSLVFGIITCAAGLVGVVIGSTVSKSCAKHLEDPESVMQANPLICAAGVLLSTPLMFFSLVYTVSSMNLGWVLIFFAVTCMCINWAVNVDIIMVCDCRSDQFQLLISECCCSTSSCFGVSHSNFGFTFIW